MEPRPKGLLELIRKNAKRMGQLIDDLLTFSRLGRQPIKKSKIDMKELAENVFEELKAINPGRNIQLRVHSLPRASGDLSMLRQVYVNLLSNAIKYSRPRDVAVIDVGCEVGGNYQNIYYVRDNGAGFDMKYVDKLFGVFQRLHSQDEFEGTGVGLALVQRIIERHGGRIWAEAKVGEGAAFHFTLEQEEEAQTL